MPLRSVSCPDNVDAKPGNTLACKIVASDGIAGVVTGHITSASKGHARVVFSQSDFHQAGSRLIVSGLDGSFAAVVPGGFADVIFKDPGLPPSLHIELRLFEPPHRFIDVLRFRALRPTLGGAFGAALRDLKSDRHTYGFSSVRRWTVGGAPARGVEYSNRIDHMRRGMIVVNHKGSTYVIRYPADTPTSLAAFGELIRGWSWR